jgi:hypothetical protein
MAVTFQYFSYLKTVFFFSQFEEGQIEKLGNCTFMLPYIVIDFFLNNRLDAPIIQFYSVMKLYMFQASTIPIIMSFLQYIWHW